jgi:hypothetical protein
MTTNFDNLIEDYTGIDLVTLCVVHARVHARARVCVFDSILDVV